MDVDTSLADPDLHLFFADDEIDSLVGVTRFINQLRRDAPEPVLPADQPWEWHHIQASKVLHDPAMTTATSAGIWPRSTAGQWPASRANCLAISRDGIEWEKPDHGFVRLPDGTPTNVIQRAARDRGATAHALSRCPPVPRSVLSRRSTRAPGAPRRPTIRRRWSSAAGPAGFIARPRPTGSTGR